MWHRTLRLVPTLSLAALVVSACASDNTDPTPSSQPPSENVASRAFAATGVCDSNAPTSTDACINAIQASGGKVVNDIFRDVNGKTADQLPVFGKLFNAWPGCTDAPCAGCSPGQSNPPYDCPSQYTCPPAGKCTFPDVAAAVNSLDRVWGQPCRLADHSLDANSCPKFVGNCIADGTGGSYFPWEGMVFDLGGPSNKVAIFAENDHGPQPCESLEYTVFLTDNPLSKEIVLKPTTDGADPNKWNRAVLKEIYTEGFVKIRATDPAGHAACGDTSQYSVEEDSMVEVYSMPCGITFRYAAVVAGNDGLDFPECQFHSNEAELDAVAGLTESGAGVCPDADKDFFVSCACAGAPAICDCNDADPNIYPGAPEKCDDADKNCDGKAGACTVAGTKCYQSQCLPPCDDKGNDCLTGATCSPTPLGDLCVQNDCTTGTCPPGSVCNASTKKCVPACTGVKCPVSQVCRDGQCIDPCAGIVCPSNETCQGGTCKISCSCYASSIGCDPGKSCDKGNTDACVDAPCVGVVCTGGKHCEVQGGVGVCLGLCDGVTCPSDQNPCTDDLCDPVKGCVHNPKADGSACPDADQCNGAEKCMAGKCVASPALNCDDNNSCTVDSCDGPTGCKHTNLPDGNPCTDGTTCAGTKGCKAGACACGTGGAGGAGGAAGAAGSSGAAGGSGTAGASGAGAGGKGGAAGGGGAAGASGTSGASGAAGKAGGAGAGGSTSAGNGGAAGNAGGGTAGKGGAQSGAAGAAGTTPGTAGKAGGATAAPSETSGDSGGCGCEVAGASAPKSALGMAMLAFAAAGLRRRNKRD